MRSRPVVQPAVGAPAVARLAAGAPLTVAADPMVEGRLREVLDRLIAAAPGIPGLEAILLGGSLAWGEASAHREAGGRVVVGGDIEAYLVGSSAALRGTARDLSASLTAESGAEVNVAWLHPRRLATGSARNISIGRSDTILAYELATAARVLYGREPRVRAVDPRTIPVAEGVRLILNRAVEATLRLDDPSDASRWLDKLLMAMADTMLLLDGSYEGGYASRLTRVRHAIERWETRGFLPAGAGAPIERAYCRKLGDQSLPAPDAGLVAAVIDHGLRHALKADLDLAVPDWAAFPALFARRAAGRPAYLRYHAPLGLSRYFESAVVALRGHRAGLRSGSQRWASVTVGRPLSLELLGAGVPLLFARLGETGLGPVDAAEGDRLRRATARTLRRAGIPAGAADANGLAVDLVRAWTAIR